MMSGIDLYIVGKLLGHASVKTTQIHAHLAQDHLKQAAYRIQFCLHGTEGTVAARLTFARASQWRR